MWIQKTYIEILHVCDLTSDSVEFLQSSTNMWAVLYIKTRRCISGNFSMINFKSLNYPIRNFLSHKK